MATPSNLLIHTLPFLSGVMFSGMGWIYQSANRRHIPPAIINIYLGLTGTLYFGSRCLSIDWSDVPNEIWIWGGVAGATQFLIPMGMKIALDRGPLSPVWCALNLIFVSVAIYAAIVLGEPLTLLTTGAVIAGIAAVVLGSSRQNPSPPKTVDEHSDSDSVSSEARTSSPPGKTIASFFRPLLYGGLLFGLLIINSVMNVGIKAVGSATDASGVSLMDRFGNLFFFQVYIGIFLPLAVFYGLRAPHRILTRRTFVYGIAAGACSTFGLWGIGVASVLPAVYTFTISSVTAILLTGIVSVVRFREKPDFTWIAMMVCAILSVILVGLGTQ